MKPIAFSLAMFVPMVFGGVDAQAGARLELGPDARLARTVIVGPGATGLESGARLRDALASVAASAETPWLIKIEPGVYDLGEGSLEMKPWVDIEGSGQAITVIRSRVGGLGGVVQGSSDAEIRDLKIVNAFDGDDFGVGLACAAASPVIRNVTVEMDRECQDPKGIYSTESDLELIGVTVRVTGGQFISCVSHTKGNLRARGLRVEASAAAQTLSVIGVRVSQAGTRETPARLENTRIVVRGAPENNGMEETCGLYLMEAVAEVADLDCRAEGGGYNVGVRISDNPGPFRLAGARVVAGGGAFAIALEMAHKAAGALTGVRAAAVGADEGNTGLECSPLDGAQPLHIHHCSITGATHSIFNGSPASTLYVGASRLDGPVSATGAWHCARCYDGDNADLDGSCR